MLSDLTRDSILSELADEPLTEGDTYTNEAEAELALRHSGGKARCVALFQGDRRVDARLIQGQYGPVWLVHREDPLHSERRYIPYDDYHLENVKGYRKVRSRVQEQLGLTQRYEVANAQYVRRSSASNFATWVTIIRAA